MAVKIEIEGSKVVEAEESQTLLEILLQAGEFVDNPCNGMGTCGKCKVKILKGECTPLTLEEKGRLKPEEIEDRVRLSCMTNPKSDLSVQLMQKKLEHKVLTTGKMPEFERDENLDGFGFAIDIGTTTVVASLVDLSTGEELSSSSDINAQKHFGLDVLTRITYEFEHPDTGVKELQEAIVGSLNAMMVDACKQARVNVKHVQKINVAANCTMMHMLLGVDARSIGTAPYEPAFRDAQTMKAKDIGLKGSDDCILYCLPQVSSYIGADIVAGAYVCEMQKSSDNELFIDIGTNGEIVLAKGGKLFSCSCAAGPALEGMNISCGMRAATGAIEEVRIKPTGIEYDVIGGGNPSKGIREQGLGISSGSQSAAPTNPYSLVPSPLDPEGICGSGILAVIRELIVTGIVQNTGAFVKPDKLEETDWRRHHIRLNGTKRELVVCEDPEIIVTQSDVRQVQMAKGAILSGFMALLQEAEIQMEDLDKVFIAGQFGAHLSVDSLVGSGILPACVQDKLVYVGNSSKTGAYMTLLSEKVKEEIEELAREISYLELSNLENYDRLYSDCMMFPEF